MAYYVGLDVSLKTTAICVVDRDQNIVWQGSADTHPEMILNALDRWIGSIMRIGLETGSSSPWLARALKARNLPVIVMDARRTASPRTRSVRACSRRHRTGPGRKNRPR